MNFFGNEHTRSHSRVINCEQATEPESPGCFCFFIQQDSREVTRSLEARGQGRDRSRAVPEEAAPRPADLRGNNLRESAACGQRSVGKEEVVAAWPRAVPLPPLQ